MTSTSDHSGKAPDASAQACVGGASPPADLPAALREIEALRRRLGKTETQRDELHATLTEIEGVLARFSSLYDLSPVPYFTLDRAGGIQRTNLAGAALLGVERSQLRQRSFEGYLGEESRPTFRAFLARVFLSHVDETCEVGIAATGSHPPLYAQILAIDDQEEQTCSVVVTDITRRHQIEEALQTSEAHYHGLVEELPLGVAITRDDTVKFLNLQAMHMIGYLADELVGQPFLPLVWAADRDEVASIQARRQRGEAVPSSYEAGVVRRDGELRHWRIHETSVFWEGEVAVLKIFEDISEQKVADLKLRELSSIVEHSADAISLSSPTGVIRYVNRAFERMYGYAADEVVGRTYSLLKSGTQDEDFYGRMWQVITSGRDFQAQLVNRRKNGDLCHVYKTITPIIDGAGSIVSYTSVDKDFNAEVIARSEIEHLALHDSLTGLANRSLFADRVRQAIARARRQDTGFAVLYIDLDDFKPINDRYGHKAGDAALQEVSRRLKDCTRAMDTVARIGGDEFAIVLEAEDRSQAVAAARKIVDAVRDPIPLGDTHGRLGASIGISLFPYDGDDSAGLLRGADEAMYRAKRLGKNRAICRGCAVNGSCRDACTHQGQAET